MHQEIVFKAIKEKNVGYLTLQLSTADGDQLKRERDCSSAKNNTWTGWGVGTGIDWVWIGQKKLSV